MALQLLSIALVVALAISSLSLWLLLPIALLLVAPVLSLVVVRFGRGRAIEYLRRDWRGQPQDGEFSIARGHLFLRVPGMTEAYVKPTRVTQVGESTFEVRGGWRKRYLVQLSDKPEGDGFLTELNALLRR